MLLQYIVLTATITNNMQYPHDSQNPYIYCVQNGLEKR